MKSAELFRQNFCLYLRETEPKGDREWRGAAMSLSLKLNCVVRVEVAPEMENRLNGKSWPVRLIVPLQCDIHPIHTVNTSSAGRLIAGLNSQETVCHWLYISVLWGQTE